MAGMVSLPVYCRIVCRALAARPCLSYHPAGQKERRPGCRLGGCAYGRPLSATRHGGATPCPPAIQKARRGLPAGLLCPLYSICPLWGAGGNAALCLLLRSLFALARLVHKIIDGKRPPQQGKNGVHRPDDLRGGGEVEPDEKGRAEHRPAHGKE